MSFGEDEEILQDFLVEAGEIIEQLSEQLVELEQSPDDKDLLNAIFRGFHTVKGGAGFLQIDPMVECCHVTENLFDILRNGQREVNAELMDVVLQALDTVTSQFDQLQNGDKPSEPAPELIRSLEMLVSGEDISDDSQRNTSNDAEEEAYETSHELKKNLDITDAEYEEILDSIDSPPSGETQSSPQKLKNDEITEDEFEDLLDELHGKGLGPTAKKLVSEPPKNSDEITEDEFEQLLDELHGSGNGPGNASKNTTTEKLTKTSGRSKEKNQNDQFIDEKEFDELLDQLHGKNSGPSSSASKNELDAKESNDKPAAAIRKVTPSSNDNPKPSSKIKSITDKSIAGTTNTDKTTAKKPKDTNPQAEATVRVDTQRLDDIMNMVGELVLVRNRLVRLGLESSEEPMQKAVANLDVVTADLQTAVMKTRMQPIKKVFGRFPRVVRDLARSLNKEIKLELKGEETDLDKNLVEALADPLVHLVRNSVDHGIETPQKREENGKSRVGKIVLSAKQEGDHILLSILDDGGGMDPDALRDKAVEKGVLDTDAAARLSDSDAFNLIFAPGFSTKQEISDVSGRGVGMDVVKTKITQLNGSINIDSKIDEGTTITIKVPLTLAIMPTLMIMLGSQTFALPLVSVNEIYHMDLTLSNKVDGQECITIREKAIPLFYLKNWLLDGNVKPDKPKEGHVVIVSVGTHRVGFVVDQLIGQEEVVIKPLGRMLQGTPGMAGATITGDGTIALILDVPSMLKRYSMT